MTHLWDIFAGYVGEDGAGVLGFFFFFPGEISSPRSRASACVQIRLISDIIACLASIRTHQHKHYFLE
jgi:hypothetical protein